MKKTMKKVIAAMVSAAMLLPLAACGNSNATSATAPAAAASSDGAAAEKKGGDGTGSPGGVDHTQGASFKIRFATNSSAGDVAGEGISQTGKGYSRTDSWLRPPRNTLAAHRTAHTRCSC